MVSGNVYDENVEIIFMPTQLIRIHKFTWSSTSDIHLWMHSLRSGSEVSTYPNVVRYPNLPDVPMQNQVAIDSKECLW